MPTTWDRVGRPRHWCGNGREGWLCRDIVAVEGLWRRKRARSILHSRETSALCLDP